jgi:uncharacterized protein
MTDWTFSHYSAAFPTPQGELLLCNSFMGALIRIGADHRAAVERAIRLGVKSGDPGEPVVGELCRQGFFVKSDLDETGLVTKIIEKERDESGFSMILMPHENCNFRCVYCYESFARGRMKKDVVAGLKSFVARNIDQWRHFGVAWFGGEPLLARDVMTELSDSFMETCTAAGIPYRSGITTNGYLLTPAVARSLLDRNVRLFQITVDGPEATHNARRHLVNGKATYHRILENLEKMRSHPDDFTVRLRVNFDRESVDEIEGWLGEVAPVFAGDRRFQFDFQAIGRWGGPNDAELSVCEGSATTDARLRLYRASGQNGFSLQTISNFVSSHGAACYAGKKSSIVVGSDGALYKCTVAFDDPRNKIGRITPDGTLMIDQGLWNMWVGTEDKNTKKCGSCWFNASCQSRACPLVAMDHAEKEPPCPSTPTEIYRLVELAAYGGQAMAVQ